MTVIPLASLAVNTKRYSPLAVLAPLRNRIVVVPDTFLSDSRDALTSLSVCSAAMAQLTGVLPDVLATLVYDVLCPALSITVAGFKTISKLAASGEALESAGGVPLF